MIIGGGGVALRKIRLITAAGGIPCVVAPSIHEETDRLVRKHDGEVHRRDFCADDLKNVSLVFNATGDNELARDIYDLANKALVPVNTVDNQEFCTFITPAIIDREPLLVALSTGGRSPVIARRIRAELEARLPSDYGKLVHFMGSLRDEVKNSLAEERRRSFYENLLDSKLPSLVFAGKFAEAYEFARERMTGNERQDGEVWLAGAGPGAVGHLTLQTLQLMHNADIILHDRLVGEKILTLARRDADMVSVGKPGTTQQDINRMMIEHARQGKQVLRLKGGDPGIYGRLAEEIGALTKAGIVFHIVPGVTAALACAAYTGIPLTDRQLAHGVSFLTFAQPQFETNESMITARLKSLVHTGHTLVIYMGVESLPTGTDALLRAGMDKATPCIVVQSLGFAEQRQLRCELADLPTRATGASLRSPAVIIVGKVIKETL